MSLNGEGIQPPTIENGQTTPGSRTALAEHLRENFAFACAVAFSMAVIAGTILAPISLAINPDATNWILAGSAGVAGLSLAAFVTNRFLIRFSRSEG